MDPDLPDSFFIYNLLTSSGIKARTEMVSEDCKRPRRDSNRNCGQESTRSFNYETVNTWFDGIRTPAINQVCGFA